MQQIWMWLGIGLFLFILLLIAFAVAMGLEEKSRTPNGREDVESVSFSTVITDEAVANNAITIEYTLSSGNKLPHPLFKYENPSQTSVLELTGLRIKIHQTVHKSTCHITKEEITHEFVSKIPSNITVDELNESYRQRAVLTMNTLPNSPFDESTITFNRNVNIYYKVDNEEEVKYDVEKQSPEFSISSGTSTFAFDIDQELVDKMKGKEVKWRIVKEQSITTSEISQTCNIELDRKSGMDVILTKDFSANIYSKKHDITHSWFQKRLDEKFKVYEIIEANNCTNMKRKIVYSFTMPQMSDKTTWDTTNYFKLNMFLKPEIVSDVKEHQNVFFKYEYFDNITKNYIKFKEDYGVISLANESYYANLDFTNFLTEQDWYSNIQMYNLRVTIENSYQYFPTTDCNVKKKKMVAKVIG